MNGVSLSNMAINPTVSGVTPVANGSNLCAARPAGYGPRSAAEALSSTGQTFLGGRAP